MPTQESVDHVWRILLDPPVLSGLACWQEEDRYGLLYAIWVYSFWSSFVSYQAACLIRKFFWSILSVLYGRHFIIYLLLCNKSLQQQHSSSHSVWIWISWVLWSQGCKQSAWAAVITIRLICMAVGKIQFLAARLPSIQPLTIWQPACQRE